LPLLAALHLVAELLALVQIANSRPFDGRNVHEHVLGAIIGLDESVALLGVEPLYGSSSHCKPFKEKLRGARNRASVKLRYGTESKFGGSRRARKCWRTMAVIVSGSEEHFPRQMMAPASSMTQMEGRLERNVEADIMALLIHAFLRLAFDTAEVTGSPGTQPTPAITPCPVACDQVCGARRRGTETVATLGGLPPSVACISQRLDA
jgi:hypothetical protein